MGYQNLNRSIKITSNTAQHGPQYQISTAVQKNLDHRNLWTAVPNLNRSTKNLDRNLEPQYQISTKKISTTGIYEPQYQISTAVQKISTTGMYESQYKNNFNRSTIFEPQYQNSKRIKHNEITSSSNLLNL